MTPRPGWRMSSRRNPPPTPPKPLYLYAKGRGHFPGHLLFPRGYTAGWWIRWCRACVLGGDLPWVVRGCTTLRGGQMWLCWLSKPSEFHSNLDTFVRSSADNHHLFSRFPHRWTSPPVFPFRSFRGGSRPPPVVPPDTDTCDTILAVDWERDKVEAGRETWEGPSSSCSLSSSSSGSEPDESDSESEGRPMRSLCFLVILRWICFGCDSSVAGIWKAVSIGWHIGVWNLTCMLLHKDYERKVLAMKPKSLPVITYNELWSWVNITHPEISNPLPRGCIYDVRISWADPRCFKRWRRSRGAGRWVPTHPEIQ